MPIRNDPEPHHGQKRWHPRPLGLQQLAILREAAIEVACACPWVWIDSDRRIVDSLVHRGLAGATSDAFGITIKGLWALRQHDRPLAIQAAQGLRRNRDEGEVLPWQI